MNDFRTNPRYQRAIQKLMTMSPEQKAIFDTLAVDREFASEEMRKQLRSMSMAARREQRA